MEALSAFFTVHSVPQTILVLSLVIATGLAIGSGVGGAGSTLSPLGQVRDFLQSARG
ncbi:MAG: hypothetical protein HYZ87_00475 [Candidatus Omnitrophica bacterium]|nr:hypothetical protein [Candidatus Omnitrophota bacterium]